MVKEPRPTGVLPGAHLPALDGLRGVAVLMVLLFHFAHLDRPGGAAQRWLLGATGAGWAGVDLFFVLSGFLITGILLDARGARGYFRAFYLRRVLRIFPLYYAYLAVLFWVVQIGRASPDRRSRGGRSAAPAGRRRRGSSRVRPARRGGCR